MMKDRYWIIIAFLFCILVGYFSAFTIQFSYHSYYNSMMDWNTVLWGGILLGLLYFGPLAVLILVWFFNSEKYTTVK